VALDDGKNPGDVEKMGYLEEIYRKSVENLWDIYRKYISMGYRRFDRLGLTVSKAMGC